jgi:fused signal recognition particle receptor
MVFKFLKSSYEAIKRVFIKTGSFLGSKLRSLFQGLSGKVDEETLEKLEQIFYEADLGLGTSQELTAYVRRRLGQNPDITSEEIIKEIREKLYEQITAVTNHKKPATANPLVILVIGVNGNGKTTSIAKLAYQYKQEGKTVIIAAADTFRAAAIEQLETWAHRLDIQCVKGKPKSDPASVAFDAVTAAKARGADVVIIDTAGRLHTKTDLMVELEKIRKACTKVIPEAPHETYLVLDATTGQNAIDQATTFHKYTPISGLILTKLDGTAKGGTVLSIQKKLQIPVRYIGVGEQLEDLQPFDPEAFLTAMFE